MCSVLTSFYSELIKQCNRKKNLIHKQAYFLMFGLNVFMLEICKIFLLILCWEEICYFKKTKCLEYFFLFAHRNCCDENFREQVFLRAVGGDYEMKK